MKATDNPPTQNPEDWTDIECAEGMLEVIHNCGEEAMDGIVELVRYEKKHMPVIVHFLSEYLKQRGKPMPPHIHNAISRAIEGCLRQMKRTAADRKRGHN